jgi:hypothetical protein
MALQKQYQMDTGIELDVAYFKIIDFFMSHQERRAGLRVAVYKDQPCRTENKTPVAIIPYTINGGDSFDQQAYYNLGLEPVSGMTITVDFTGNDVSPIIFTEGQDFNLGADVNETAINIVAALNENSIFNANFQAMPYGESSIGIQAKSDGSYSGSKGNSLVITSAALAQVFLQAPGVDAVLSPFAQFFDLPVIGLADCNPISQGYKYLRSLPEYADVIDV